MANTPANPETVTHKKKIGFAARLAMPAMALAVFAAVAVLVQPAAAVDINLSVITDVINAFIGIIEPLISLVIAIVPLWFILEILGFIMGVLAAILAMIKFKR